MPGRSHRSGDEHPGKGIRVVPRHAADIPHRVSGWIDAVARRGREHPGRSAALALGAGYVLGGGLFSRLTARLVGTGMRFGLRAILIPFVTEHLIALGQEILTPDAEAAAAGAGGDGGSSPVRAPHKGEPRHPDKKEKQP